MKDDLPKSLLGQVAQAVEVSFWGGNVDLAAAKFNVPKDWIFRALDQLPKSLAEEDSQSSHIKCEIFKALGLSTLGIYTPLDLGKAIVDIVTQWKHMVDVSVVYNVPLRTLQRKIAVLKRSANCLTLSHLRQQYQIFSHEKKLSMLKACIFAKPGTKGFLTDNEIAIFGNVCNYMANAGFGLTRRSMKTQVSKLIRKKDIRRKRTDEVVENVSSGFLTKNFGDRLKHLNVMKPSQKKPFQKFSRLSANRAEAANPRYHREMIHKFRHHFSSLYSNGQLPSPLPAADHVYNVDEIGVSDCDKHGSVFSLGTVSCGRKFLIGPDHASQRCSVLICTRADGEMPVPPVLIYRSQDEKKIPITYFQNVPDDWMVTTSVAGHCDVESFAIFAEAFAHYCHGTEGNRAFLYLDGYFSHWDVQSADYLSKHFVDIMFLSAGNSTNDQPNDLGLNSRFKTALSHNIEEALIERGGIPLTVPDFNALLHKTWVEVKERKDTGDVISRAFAKAGLHPLRDIFDDVDQDSADIDKYDDDKLGDIIEDDGEDDSDVTRQTQDQDETGEEETVIDTDGDDLRSNADQNGHFAHNNDCDGIIDDVDDFDDFISESYDDFQEKLLQSSFLHPANDGGECSHLEDDDFKDNRDFKDDRDLFERIFNASSVPNDVRFDRFRHCLHRLVSVNPQDTSILRPETLKYALAAIQGNEKERNFRVEYKKSGYIEGREIQFLSPGSELNDNLLDWLVYLTTTKRCEQELRAFVQFEVVSADWYSCFKSIEFSPRSYWHGYLRGAARNTIMANVFDKKMLLIPINSGHHWMLLVLLRPDLLEKWFHEGSWADSAVCQNAVCVDALTQPLFLFYDSLGCRLCPPEFCKSITLSLFVHHFCRQKYKTIADPQTNKISRSVGENVAKDLEEEFLTYSEQMKIQFKLLPSLTVPSPKQENNFDCGLFTVANVDELLCIGAASWSTTNTVTIPIGSNYATQFSPQAIDSFRTDMLLYFTSLFANFFPELTGNHSITRIANEHRDSGDAVQVVDTRDSDILSLSKVPVEVDTIAISSGNKRVAKDTFNESKKPKLDPSTSVPSAAMNAAQVSTVYVSKDSDDSFLEKVRKANEIEDGSDLCVTQAGVIHLTKEQMEELNLGNGVFVANVCCVVDPLTTDPKLYATILREESHGYFREKFADNIKEIIENFSKYRKEKHLKIEKPRVRQYMKDATNCKGGAIYNSQRRERVQQCIEEQEKRLSQKEENRQQKEEIDRQKKKMRVQTAASVVFQVRNGKGRLQEMKVDKLKQAIEGLTNTTVQRINGKGPYKKDLVDQLHAFLEHNHTIPIDVANEITRLENPSCESASS